MNPSKTDTIPAGEPDTTPERPVYQITMPSGFPWADQKLTIPAPHTADDIAMVIHTELTEVGYAAGTLDVTVELSTGGVQVSYQGWTSTDGTITGPGVGSSAEPDTTAILDALAAAGLTVTGHQIEADSIDIHLAHRYHMDYAATSLSWRPDGQGWYLLPVDQDGDEEWTTPDYLRVTDPAEVVDAVMILVELVPSVPAPAERDHRDRLADELHRIADAIRTRRVPAGSSTRLNLGVIDSRSDLEQLAAYLGTTVEVDDRNNIPHIRAVQRLAGEQYRADLTIVAQTHPEQSEVERLRAENARLAAALEATQGGESR